jgi:hypothetical protein
MTLAVSSVGSALSRGLEAPVALRFNVSFAGKQVNLRRLVGEQRVIDQMGRRIGSSVRFDFGESRSLREKAPKEVVHHARQASNVHPWPCTRQLLQELKTVFTRVVVQA